MLIVYFLQFQISRIISTQLCSKVIIVLIYRVYKISLFLGLILNNLPDQVLDLFDQMVIKPNEFTLAILLKACAQVSNESGKEIGKRILHQMPNNFQNNQIILTSGINMLMKYHEIADAERLFQMIKQKDIVSYGAMMNGYNTNNEPLKCFKLFEQMKQQMIVPNEVVFLILIDACSLIGMRSRCESIVTQIPINFYKNQFICNSLINMWVSIDC
jgi:pentatricopeptide repeat protein